MLTNPAEIIKLLEDIKSNHHNCDEQYDSVVSKSNRVLMSKTNNTSLYGMFYPYDKMKNYLKYDGIIVEDKLKSDFVYYFDNEKLQLTVRNMDKNDVYHIYYYYIDSRIDLVWYSCKRRIICVVGFIEIMNEVKFRFVESDDYSALKSYKEFLFDDEKKEIKYTLFAQGFLPGNKDYVKTNTFKSIKY